MQDSQDRFSTSPSAVKVLVRDGSECADVLPVRHLEPFIPSPKFYQQQRDEFKSKGFSLPPLGFKRFRKREKLYLGDNAERKPWMHWAREQVRRAIKRGEMSRPAICSMCGKTGRISGHHDDYNKPFEVRWLCDSCHRNWHLGNDPVIPQDFESLRKSFQVRNRG